MVMYYLSPGDLSLADPSSRRSPPKVTCFWAKSASHDGILRNATSRAAFVDIRQPRVYNNVKIVIVCANDTLQKKIIGVL